MTDIKHAARLAGVSPAKVSRVLNDHPYVSDRTREKVRRVVESDNYHPNALAANLRRKVSDVVGYLQFGRPGLEDGRLAQVAESKLFSAGFRTFSCNAGFDSEREAFYLGEMTRQRVAGVILFARAHGEHGQDRRALAAARRLGEAGVVMIGNNLARGIRGGNALGLVTVWLDWVDRYEKLPSDDIERPNYVAKTPVEVLEIIDRLASMTGDKAYSLSV